MRTATLNDLQAISISGAYASRKYRPIVQHRSMKVLDCKLHHCYDVEYDECSLAQLDLGSTPQLHSNVPQ